MIEKRIKSIKEEEFSDFWDLYESSFPMIEKRTIEQEEVILANSFYHLDVFYDEDNFIGFLSYWEFDAYLYVEHFAINNIFRGCGFGNTLLRQLINRTKKVIILEIDPVVDEVSKSRLHFYETIGFVKNAFDYRVPSYQNKSQWYDLVIMTYPRLITQNELDIFRYDFENTIL